MRLLQLRLIAFGPFTDVTLDLSAGHEGLHVVYGPNEAGKSSALRALRQLFYGIAHVVSDTFLHLNNSLRIGATIRHSDDSELSFVRRKGRSHHALRGSDDVTIISPDELARFLGGVEQDAFETLFGIDHKTLVTGGQEILQGGGQLGPILFAASSGIAGLQQVRDRLRLEYEGLFKKSGKNQRIVQTIKDYEATQQRIKGMQLSTEEWARHDRALQDAVKQKDLLEEEWQAKSRAQSRLSRIRSALPAVAHRKKLLAELEAYRSAVLLPDDFGETVREVASSLAAAQDRARRAGQTLEQLDRSCEPMVVPRDLLDRAEKIEELHRKLGEVEKGTEDRPALVQQKQNLEQAALEILKKLGRPPELTRTEELRLRADEPAWIQDLGNQRQALLADCGNAQQKVIGVKRRLETARAELASLGDLPDPTELRRTLRQALQKGALEEDWAAARETLAQANEQARVDLARLPHWHGTLEALEILPLPSPETLDRFDADLGELQRSLTRLADRLADEEAEAAKTDVEIRQLQLQQEVPTENSLQQARAARDRGWGLVREAWQKGQAAEEAVADYVASNPPAQHLAAAYEHSVARADQVADRLRREADRVARIAELVSQRDKRAQQVERLASEHQAQEKKRTRLLDQWAELWQPLGLPPFSVKEVRSWLRRQADLTRQAQTVRAQRERVRRLEDNIAGVRTQLGACLSALGEPGAAESETLTHLVERGQEVVSRFEAVSSRRRHLQIEIQEQETELASAETAVRRAEEDLSQWRLQWARAMARLGLSVDALPAAASSFLAAINELFQKLREADSFANRVIGIDRDARDFAVRVQALTRQVAPDLEDAPADQTVRDLNARLTRAREAQKERQSLDRQRAEERNRLRAATEDLTVARRRLDFLCQEARCATPDELMQAARRSASRKALEKDLKQREEEILGYGAGATMEELIAQAETLDPDALESQIHKLETENAALQKQKEDLSAIIGREEGELARMTGSSAAAEAAEDAASLLAQLQTDVQDYAALRLATLVLRKGIERFREKHQGTVLERASRFFSRLTAGSFVGLRIDYDDNGDAILVGIRPQKQQAVRVEGMSDGSCDQLYLALRLAALESWLDSHEPIPFIVDDILLNFDNERAVAALQALADLSRRTQVILFTHHQHLVELAQQSLATDVLFTHNLTFGAPGPRGASFGGTRKDARIAKQKTIA
jgi:uncharacterized protein YhaN